MGVDASKIFNTNDVERLNEILEKVNPLPLIFRGKDAYEKEFEDLLKNNPKLIKEDELYNILDGYHIGIHVGELYGVISKYKKIRIEELYSRIEDDIEGDYRACAVSYAINSILMHKPELIDVKRIVDNVRSENAIVRSKAMNVIRDMSAYHYDYVKEYLPEVFTAGCNPVLEYELIPELTSMMQRLIEKDADFALSQMYKVLKNSKNERLLYDTAQFIYKFADKVRKKEKKEEKVKIISGLVSGLLETAGFKFKDLVGTIQVCKLDDLLFTLNNTDIGYDIFTHCKLSPLLEKQKKSDKEWNINDVEIYDLIRLISVFGNEDYYNQYVFHHFNIKPIDFGIEIYRDEGIILNNSVKSFVKN